MKEGMRMAIQVLVSGKFRTVKQNTNGDEYVMVGNDKILLREFISLNK